MTLEEIKKLNITITKTTTFSLMEDISEDYLKIFLKEFIPEAYNKNWEDMSDEELMEALKEFNYHDDMDLDELLDNGETKVKIWKQEQC